MSERDPLYIRSMDIFMEICRQMSENRLAKWYIESFAKFVSYHMVHKDFSASIAKIYPRIFSTSCYHFQKPTKAGFLKKKLIGRARQSAIFSTFLLSFDWKYLQSVRSHATKCFPSKMKRTTVYRGGFIKKPIFIRHDRKV